LVCLGILLFFIYKTILIRAGEYFAPEKDGKADVAILESTGTVRPELMNVGKDLISTGKANKVLVLVHQGSKESQSSALTIHSRTLAEKLEGLGLKGTQFKIIRVPSNHPITLTAARIVLPDLSREGVKSAILVSEGFHTRRSYWTYKQAGLPLGIDIIPSPYYYRYTRDGWWTTSTGVYAFFLHVSKYLYYVIRGYIPLKSVVTV
jgi:hypothetical protein